MRQYGPNVAENALPTKGGQQFKQAVFFDRLIIKG